MIQTFVFWTLKFDAYLGFGDRDLGFSHYPWYK